MKDEKSRLRLFFKLIWTKPIVIWIYIFYKVKYLKDEPSRSGFYLIKRWWLWLLLFPVLSIGGFFFAAYHILLMIFSYDSHWLSGEPNHKMDIVERLYKGYRLFK